MITKLENEVKKKLSMMFGNNYIDKVSIYSNNTNKEDEFILNIDSGKFKSSIRYSIHDNENKHNNNLNAIIDDFSKKYHAKLK